MPFCQFSFWEKYTCSSMAPSTLQPYIPHTNIITGLLVVEHKIFKWMFTEPQKYLSLKLYNGLVWLLVTCSFLIFHKISDEWWWVTAKESRINAHTFNKKHNYHRESLHTTMKPVITPTSTSLTALIFIN